MADRKPCIRCQRQIDGYARICPYCNWEQSETPPPEETESVPAWSPPQRPWRNRLLGGIALAALLVIAFVVGAFVHDFNGSDVHAAQAKTPAENPQAPFAPTPPKNVTLVPFTGTESTAPLGPEPITSAPPAVAGEGLNDTTAMPSGQYVAAAARAKAEQQKEQQQAEMTDPRSLTGAPYAQPRQPEPVGQQPAGMASAQTPPESPQNAGLQNGSPQNPPYQAQFEAAPRPGQSEPVRTSAYPESKPLPRIYVDHDMTARLTVTVNPNGRVTDIEVNQSVPRIAEIIAAVQRWQFKPATENGDPVTARVAVDITFHGNG